MSDFIDAHPAIVGGLMLLVGVILLDTQRQPYREPDGCLTLLGLALLVVGFFGVIGVIS